MRLSSRLAPAESYLIRKDSAETNDKGKIWPLRILGILVYPVLHSSRKRPSGHTLCCGSGDRRAVNPDDYEL